MQKNEFRLLVIAVLSAAIGFKFSLILGIISGVAYSIPVIGMGGISTPEDVIEFMLAGASAVQIGTASYWDPCATEKIVDGLEQWCKDHHVTRIADVIGGMQLE